MYSEFEKRRNRRIIDDYFDYMVTDMDEDDVICDERLHPVFKLNTSKGVCCADCGTVIDLTRIEAD